MLIWFLFMASAIFPSSFSLISLQDTFPPSACSTTWRRVEPSLTGLSPAMNIQHSLSLYKLHSLIGVGYTDEFSQTFWVGISKAFDTLLPLLWLQSHWPDAALADFRGLPQASKAARWDGSWELWKTHSLFPLFVWGLCASTSTGKCPVVHSAVCFTLPPSAWYSFSSAPSSFASPKSVIFTCWGVFTRTFLAARSRCTKRRSSR